jgi:hypothetical protein
VGVLFTLETISFDEQKLLSFMRSHLSTTLFLNNSVLDQNSNVLLRTKNKIVQQCKIYKAWDSNKHFQICKDEPHNEKNQFKTDRGMAKMKELVNKDIKITIISTICPRKQRHEQIKKRQSIYVYINRSKLDFWR